MKHIRTEWGAVTYTVELTEQERTTLMGAVLFIVHSDAGRALMEALRDLGRTHPTQADKVS